MNASAWREKLSDTSEETRRRACYALGRIRPAEAATIEALVATLKDPNTEPRWYAMDALARLGPEAKAAVPGIIAALESKVNDETVKRSGAKALGLIGADAKSGTTVLTSLLTSPDPLQRIAAAVALWRITGEAAQLRPVTEAIQVGTPDAAHAALLAIGDMGDSGKVAMKVVVGALGHSDPDVRRAAASVLLAWREAAVPPIVAALGESKVHSLSALQLLGSMVDALRRDVLEKSGSDLAARNQAVDVIGKQILPAMIVQHFGAATAEKEAALQAISKAGLVAAPSLLTAISGDDSTRRPALVAALTATERYLPNRPGQNLAEPLAGIRLACLAPLVHLLGDKDRVAKLAALRYFAALAYGPEEGKGAIPKLEALLKDEDVAVRSLAAESLDRIRK